MKQPVASTRGYQPLRDAVRSGSVRDARKMINDGHSMHVSDASHNTLLHLALDPSMMMMLISKGCALEQINKAGHTPLQEAVTHDNVAGAKTLIEHGADITVTDYAGDSLVHLATSPAMILMLARKNCVLDKEDLAGYTPLQNAVWYDKVAVAQALIACGADKDVIDNGGNSLMHLASSLEMVTMLVEKKCASDLENNQGLTPYDQASSETIKLALLAASKDMTDEKGETALHRAVRANEITKAEMLVKAGYNINLENKDDDSPLVIAVDKRFREMEKKLRQLGASTYEAVLPKTMLVRNYRRAEKAAIIAKGGLSPLAGNGALPTVAEVIESRWYLGDMENKDALKGRAAALYQEPLLRPMMQVVALAGLGEHDKGRTHSKEFKIIGVNAKNVRSLRVTARALGLFTDQNSGFVALKNQSANEITATIFHESMHFVMTEVFKNDSNPFDENDSYHKRMMSNVEQATKDRLEMMEQEKPHEKIAFNAINKAFDSYKESHHAMELIARVPDIIAEVGARDGMAWLKKNVPELMDFYEKVVNPAINEYLKAHNVTGFVDIRAREERKLRTKRHKFIDIAGDAEVTDEKKGKKQKKEEALPASGISAWSFVARLAHERERTTSTQWR